MKTPSLLPLVFLPLALLCHSLPAQTSATIDPVADEVAGEAASSVAPAVAAPVPLPDFVIKSTVCKRLMAVEPAPLYGMVPVAKEITITQHLVDDPGLADPLPPVYVEPSPEAIARRKAWAALQPKRVFVHLSATVYDHQRTLLRWFADGNRDQEMVAWSALDFSVLAGMGSFNYGGVEYDLMLGLGLIMQENTEQNQRAAIHREITYQPPVFPELPPVGTPVFVVTKGDATDAAALAPITALHELYKTDSVRLLAEYEARLQAQREREAYIRAHPPEPQDVTIHFWERAHPVGMSADTIKKQEERP